MKKMIWWLTAGMMVGAVIFLVSICNVNQYGSKILIVSIVGLGLLWGCSARLEMLKTKYHLTTPTAFQAFLRR